MEFPRIINNQIYTIAERFIKRSYLFRNKKWLNRLKPRVKLDFDLIFDRFNILGEMER